MANARAKTCKRCQGNGEIVVDWAKYLKGDDDENAVMECPDCDGSGELAPLATPTQEALP